MKKMKLKLLGTSTRETRRCMVIEFTTYIPRTDVKYAKSCIPTGFRK